MLGHHCELPAETRMNPELMARQNEFQPLCMSDPDCYHLKAYHPGRSELQGLEEGSLSERIRCAPFKRPSSILVEHLKRFSAVFEDAARLYEVSENALIGCILAENSLNYGVDDAIQDWLARSASGSAAEGITGHFSIGLGQIFPTRAKQVESLAHWIEKRPLRSESEIHAALGTEVGSIYYAAAILRDAWKTYARVGVDIRENPAILCTLYNLGQVEARAEKLHLNRAKPQENYMGSFVRHEAETIETIRTQPGTCAP